MDLSVLKEFTYLSKELNFTKAAERLFMSQSVLSRHIQALESEIGCQLFIRAKSGVVLTDAGEAFAASAKSIVDDYEDALMRLREMGDDFHEILRVGYIPELTESFMDAIYELALRKQPHVRMRFLDSWEERLFHLLATDRVDIALIGSFGMLDGAVYDRLVLYSGYYDILVPEGDPLAKSVQVTLDMLADRKLLIPLRSDNPIQFKHIVKALDDHPAIAYQDSIADRHDSVALVNSGHGLAVVPHRHARTLDLRGAKALRLIEDRLNYEVCAVWKKENPSSALEGFVEMLCELVPNANHPAFS